MDTLAIIARAKEAGIIRPGFVGTFAQIAELVEEDWAAEMEAAQERAAEAAWSNVYERNDRAREEDEAEIARADALGLWPYAA